MKSFIEYVKNNTRPFIQIISCIFNIRILFQNFLQICSRLKTFSKLFHNQLLNSASNKLERFTRNGRRVRGLVAGVFRWSVVKCLSKTIKCCQRQSGIWSFGKTVDAQELNALVRKSARKSIRVQRYFPPVQKCCIRNKNDVIII